MEEHTVINLNDDDGHLKKDVSKWTSEDVRKWLRQNGYKEVETNLNNSAKPIAGHELLALTRDQLQQSPFFMTNMHEVDHLQSCIETLRKQQLTNYMKKGSKNGYHNLPQSTVNSNGRIPNGHIDTIHANGKSQPYSSNKYSKVTTPLLSDSGDERGKDSAGIHVSTDPYPPEIFKSFLAFLYMMFGFVLSVFMLQVVHERVPPVEQEPPLPDVFFDIAPKRIEGIFSVCEWSGMILTGICAIAFCFHKHRFIIVRRLFFIMGTLYLYRCLTTYVTTLPVPGFHFKCAPKVHYKLTTMIWRSWGVLTGGGLSVTGAHHYCGDYLFSGHTIILVITYLSITEYTPKRWWWLHWVSWFLAALGIVCILLAHDHYTVDIVVAYLLTTRLFWTYHTMCNVTTLKELSKSNLLSRAWWFPMFRYFEGNVVGNGPLPRRYEWPLPWPKRLRQPMDHRRTTVKRV